MLDAGRVDARLGPRVGTGSAPASAPASEPAGSPAAGPITVGYLPKDIVNQYFAAAKTGIDKGAAESGSTIIQVGPNEAKADLQIPFITDLTTQGVDAIIISADGKDEVAPALKAAMACRDQGRRLRLQPGRRRLRRLRQPGRLQRRRRQPRRLGLRARPELHRRDRDPVGRRHGDQPERVDRADEDHPRRKTSTRASRSSTPSTATTTPPRAPTQAQALLTKYPNLKVIVAPTTVGILAAAQVVKQAGKSDSVKVTGLGFPNDMKPFVADGTSPVFGLWSVPDLGYLVVRTSRPSSSAARSPGAEGDTFSVPGLNDDKPYTIGEDSIVILGPAFRFDSTNVNDFDF